MTKIERSKNDGLDSDSRLEEAGQMLRAAISDLFQDLAVVMSLSRMETLEPATRNKLTSLANEVRIGRARVDGTEDLANFPVELDLDTLVNTYPKMVRGPNLSLDDIETVVDNYRSLGRLVIAGVDAGAIAHLYYCPGDTVSVDFML
jgi:hypothetical protein